MMNGLTSLGFLALLLSLPGCGMPAGGEWMWIALIALVLFGGAKLPGLMGGLGKGMNEFKKGLKDGESSEDEDDPDALDK